MLEEDLRPGDQCRRGGETGQGPFEPAVFDVAPCRIEVPHQPLHDTGGSTAFAAHQLRSSEILSRNSVEAIVALWGWPLQERLREAFGLVVADLGGHGRLVWVGQHVDHGGAGMRERVDDRRLEVGRLLDPDP